MALQRKKEVVTAYRGLSCLSQEFFFFPDFKLRHYRRSDAAG